MSGQDRIPELTEEDRALLPTTGDVAFYAEHGWYLSPRLLTDGEVDLLRTASDRFYAGHRDRTLPAKPERLAYWTPDQGDVQRHNDYIHYEDDTIASILRKPLIGAVAARLAQVEVIRVFQATLISKPPNAQEKSNVVPWHFDRDYWATSASERMLTAFIPFHDCGTEMGTITMVDGSHRWRAIDRGAVTSRHFVEIYEEADAALDATAAFNNATVDKIPMCIPKGHMSFHHCRIYHGSGPNRSGQPRRAVSLHLQDGDNAYRQFTLPDGSIAEYNHDALVRRTPQGTPDYTDPEYCPVIWRGPAQAGASTWSCSQESAL
ncbi:phytanoyl-CoA dioxygenase family protein [Streptomyces rectiverticillatus]|uniref:phytanoyl-CoA dioxygenase family protein n=1 Tax=Streptomyces rectiverticillatus TaxID=173860 RepID=UPI0015C2DC16|nr:phytanoyl-CoA dioxygenase family protein [Streptomyces rectiverticillatus]QLE70295.1 phytanoyl-CoA dioxygenase family protein [Streptomyces rectiverticillatus]